MATRIQAQHRGNHDRTPRWARLARVDLVERDGALPPQRVSQRQAAQVLVGHHTGVSRAPRKDRYG